MAKNSFEAEATFKTYRATVTANSNFVNHSVPELALL